MRRKHHELKAWQEAISLVQDIYRITALFPKEEIYGLTSQMRRAAVSIPSNIAEGAVRTVQKEFLQFLSISRGSLSELDTLLIIANELGYIQSMESIQIKIDSLFGLLGGLINSLRARSAK